MVYVCLRPHICLGTSIWGHDNGCLTVNDYCNAEYLSYEGSELCVGVLWHPSGDRLHPHIRTYYNGILVEEWEMDNEWNNAYLCYHTHEFEGTWIFQFIPDYGKAVEMSIACRVVARSEDEEEVPSPPDAGGVDYNKIKGDVQGIIDEDSHVRSEEHTQTLDAVKWVEYGLVPLYQGVEGVKKDINTGYNNLYDVGERKHTSITNRVINLGTDIKSLIRSSSLTGTGLVMQNVNATRGALVDTINNLSFPSLTSIKQIFIDAGSSIADKIMERIIDEIERRYEK